MTPAEESSLLKARRSGGASETHARTPTSIGAGRIARKLGITKRAVSDRAARESWPYTDQIVRGGRRRLYLREGLPTPIQAALEAQEIRSALSKSRSALHEAGQTLPELPAPPSEPIVPAPAAAVESPITRRGQKRKAKAAAAMNDKDRQYQEAAVALCAAVDGAMVAADCSETRAIRELAQHVLTGLDAPNLVEAVRITYVKPRKNGQTEKALASRIQKMMPFYRAGCREGDPGRYLVAGRRERTGQKHEDIVAFLRHYCKPSRPSVAEAWADSAPWYEAQGLERPSIDTWRRIERALSVTLKYRGRMTGAAFAALKPYVNRGVSMFKANDIWVGDGHTFKARIMNPITGKAFQPELTVVIDWVSRRVLGWSAALSESTLAVSAAFRHAQQQTHARPLIYYSDNGSGQTGKKIDHPITGTASRQGFAHETGIPGNAQGRGVIERLWQTLLIPLARKYPTVLTKTADRDHVRKVTQAIAKAERAGEFCALLPTWEQFLADVAETVERYNSEHRHSGLGGMTPNEAYTAKIDPDSVVFGVSDAEISALWMPEEIRTPERGVVRLFNNEYFRRDLVEIVAEKEPVRVRYDIHDAAKVFLFRMDGTEIGEALWNGNRVAAFPVPYVERLREERRAGIVKRATKEIDRANAELSNTIDAAGVPMPDLLGQQLAARKREQERRQIARQPQPSAADQERLATLEARYSDPDPRPIKVSELRDPVAKWDHWQRLDDRHRRGIDLSDEEERFYQAFQNSTYGRNFIEGEAEFRRQQREAAA